ncbi:tyrosine-type recombinase/integrase [Paraglaciecola sp.]|uniref:tyrosine-type recombinase/integrase n=1 Tax=Paraglaciecola sp. TaxID=1920173 RepID=UPI003EF34116
MPKITKELSDRAVRSLAYRINKTGKPIKALYAVGGVSGLMLQCSAPVNDNKVFARSWILRTVVGEKRKDIGLGGYPEISLSNARVMARHKKQLVRDGMDPVAEKRKLKQKLIDEQSSAITFHDIANEYIEKQSKELKTHTQVKKLQSRLNTYVIPHIGNMIIHDIKRSHILKMITHENLWFDKTETATRVLNATGKILDIATVKGLREGTNPAQWRGNLELTLPKPSKIAKVVHYKALPYKEITVFLSKLKSQEWLSARALELVIYTACRNSEVRKAEWSEFDLENALWTIPAERMKAGKEHKVPLCDSAVKLVKGLIRDSEYLFSNSKGNPLTDASISKAPKRIGYDVTAHGFRSSFKDWSTECTSYPDEVSELALAHVNNDKTRAAYARSQLIDKRRLMMDDWDNYVNGVEQ